MTTLYNGTLYLQGLFTSVGPIAGVTTDDTILSVLNTIEYNSGKRVMMEIGAYNVNDGDFGNTYKYALGYSNLTNGQGGSFQIQACPVAPGAYTAATPITRFSILPNGNVGINTASPNYGLDVQGTTNLNGTLTLKTATWHLTSDGVVRFLYDHNGATITRSGNNIIDWRNTNDSVIFRINNGSVQFQTNTWHKSYNDGRNRVFYSENGTSFFGSGNGYIFRNSDDNVDILNINNSQRVGILNNNPQSNLDVNGSLNIGGSSRLNGNVGIGRDSTGDRLQVNGNIRADGVFYGNGSGLTNVPYASNAGYANNAGSANTAGSAGIANYATSAGSAPANRYDPIVLYNMGTYNTAAINFTPTKLGRYQHYNGWGHPDWATDNFGPPFTLVSPESAFTIFTDTGNTICFMIAKGSGSVASYSGSYGGISDSNLKENISTARDYTEDLCKLRVTKFNFKNDPTYIPYISTYTSTISSYNEIDGLSTVSTVSFTISSSKQPLIGFIAQEVQEVFPGLVEMSYNEDPDTLQMTSSLSVKVSLMVPMIVTAIQNLNRRVTSQEILISTQQALIDSLI
jgi:hypothetical protein